MATTTDSSQSTLTTTVQPTSGQVPLTVKVKATLSRS